MKILGRLILAIGLASLLAAGASHTTHAQIPGAVDGLQISPSVVELNADPGRSYQIPMRVTNVTSSTLRFTSQVNDFAARDESGTPNVILDDAPRTSSIKSWVVPLNGFTLRPNEQRTLTATITVPNDAEPGGHYGVIRFNGGVPDVEGGEVGVSASAGTLVLVRVAGALTESLELPTFAASKNDTLGSFFENGPINFVSRFENKGSVHVKPIGQIEVRDMFGNTVETLPVNPQKGNVLPLSVRRFETQLNKEWLIGRYTADLTVAYGTTGQAITRTISFWVIPWKLILIALAVLVTLFYIGRKGLQRYNAAIIAKASGASKKKPAKKKKK